MLSFTRLRLSGFKSFVDPTELAIDVGLTGIVGPNGCGKSNLVEALRWVMGETSARQMRGGEMDDVIFGGTTDRPSRSVAEVILRLDNSTRVAPALFNDHDELEVSRRIEREKGSTYRVNGKEVRARDVQLLFADAATGARSPALVSQGRVGAVIAAKPAERRLLLEEAAGIIGLHSRRHEAELRLRAAEANLERLDDILVTLDAQLQGLRKQARQASRYRNLSGDIRRTEAAFLTVRWRAAETALEAGREALHRAEDDVAALTGRAAAAARSQAERAAELPARRAREAEAAAELQRLRLARDGLDAEEQRVADAQQDCRTRLDHAAADLERERALAEEAAAAVARLADERAAIEALRRDEEGARKQAAEALAEATRLVDEADAALTAVTEQVAADEARRGALTRTLTELEERRRRLGERADDVAAQRAAAVEETPDGAALTAAEAAVEAAQAVAADAATHAEAAESEAATAAAGATAAVARRHATDAAATRLQAEEKALSEVLEPADTDLWPPVIDALTVQPGLEAALGAALGDDLTAPADEAAGVHWRTVPPVDGPPPLPAGVPPLSDFVGGADVLASRLAQVGVVDDEAAGTALRDQLAQGQRLVSRDGALWRWDGYTVGAGAATAATARLQQRSRLAEVRRLIEDAGADAAAARAEADQAQAAADAAAADDKAARAAVREADAALAAARHALAEVRQRTAAQASRLAALDETAAAIDADLADARSRGADAEAALAALPDPTAARAEAARLRAELAERRAAQAERRNAHDTLVREAEARQRRHAEIDRETESWQRRGGGAGTRIEQLEDRHRAVTAELARLSERPAEIAAQRRSLLDAVDDAEANRKAAADSLAEAEGRVAAAERELKAAEADLARAREDRVRAEGVVDQGERTCADLTERMAERLGVGPEQAAADAGLAGEGAVLPELEAVERRLERLLRERETMGPVNLRAEQEAAELTERIDVLQTERADLVKAIDKLRQGIAELNREGRRRLVASFEDVDRHFRALFERLFGGGRAHLTLTESDDPLEAGLEIMASPPGKRLQVLSLLSGGEQALTALALLFAVFLTNPAPICVLDEVDAPLDDANVDRFCTLLEEMARGGGTRFLVITHHRMTMARMDRLFGVTMMERGVSELVSVDLQRAEELRATA